MLQIAWEEKYSVNIRVLDGQHKKLFEILANLYDRMGKEDDAKFLGDRVWELSLYAVVHFDTEELFMSEYYFPGYEAHKKEHDAFKVKVASFQKDLEAGKATLSLDIVSFLLGWLQHHILTVDKEYSPFLNEKGIH